MDTTFNVNKHISKFLEQKFKQADDLRGRAADLEELQAHLEKK